MIVSFLNFFMKSYVVGTHYNHIVDKMLICYMFVPQQQLLWRNKQSILTAFLWMSFLLENRFTKDSSQTQQERSSQRLK